MWISRERRLLIKKAVFKVSLGDAIVNCFASFSLLSSAGLRPTLQSIVLQAAETVTTCCYQSQLLCFLFFAPLGLHCCKPYRTSFQKRLKL
jgi:hypothetical protein